jgi:hypothetical protein
MTACTCATWPAAGTGWSPSLGARGAGPRPGQPAAGVRRGDPVACQPCLGWSRGGWLFFFNGGPGGADPAAWRPGQRAAVPIALDSSSVTSVLSTSLAAA